MSIVLLIAALLIASPAWAQATGPVNPTTATVTLPQTNADGSTLTDLAGVVFCEGMSATAVLINCVAVATPADPPAAATATTPIAAFTIVVDGQHYLDAEAVDTAGNRSARTARIPFAWNRQAPSAPSTPTFP